MTVPSPPRRLRPLLPLLLLLQIQPHRRHPPSNQPVTLRRQRNTQPQRFLRGLLASHRCTRFTFAAQLPLIRDPPVAEPASAAADVEPLRSALFWASAF